jgi:hypothetical protein
MWVKVRSYMHWVGGYSKIYGPVASGKQTKAEILGYGDFPGFYTTGSIIIKYETGGKQNGKPAWDLQ